MLFSQRIGKTKIEKNIQLEDIDIELRNGLWNCYRMNIIDKLNYDEFSATRQAQASEYFAIRLWHDFFKKKIEDIPYHYHQFTKLLRDYFEQEIWFRVYDLFEFSLSLFNEDNDYNSWIDLEYTSEQINEILTREFSGYRIINLSIVPISNQSEIETIKIASSTLTQFTRFQICNEHLTSALSKLSDRQNPDYRNSIKESISAVEGVAKIISGNEKDTLGAAIDKLKGRLKIHPSLEKAFKNLYGYSSDSDGIRHALMEESNLGFEDAKFMLVTCSSFINYLVEKANKAGINLN